MSTFDRKLFLSCGYFFGFSLFLLGGSALGATVEVVGTSGSSTDLAGPVVRLMVGLSFVLALFLGGISLFKRWQRTSHERSKSQLDIFESRSLGPRQALYVVGYNQQRFLVASSQAGITLISPLPLANQESESVFPMGVLPGSKKFSDLLLEVMGRK